MIKRRERIHCFLFCIKYNDILPEKEEIIHNIFDFLKNLSIFMRMQIFFVVTQSEKSDSEGFKLFKEKFLKFFEKVKKIFPEKVFKFVFGENI